MVNFMSIICEKKCLVFWLLLVSFLAGRTGVQGFHFDKRYSTGLIPVQIQDAPHPTYDYFDAAKDRSVKERLQAVERYHMNKEVIELIGSGKYQYALNEINFTLNNFPNHPTALHLLTTVAALTKKRSLPIRYFEKAIALYPSHAITHAQYGWFFVTIGDLDNGIRKLNYSVELDPKLTAGYVWLSQAYERKGDTQAAREARER